MKFTIPLLFLASIVLQSSYTEVSDNLVLKKTKTGAYEERFFVYKEQPQIKQDQYVKFYTNELGAKKVVEFGRFELNQKTGMWMDFYYLRNSNMLRSFGMFVQGKKEGEWTSFFKYENDFNPFSVESNKVGKMNTTNLYIPKSNKEICVLKMDTTNVNLMEWGKYEDDKKIGVWEYYAPDGRLMQKYDHTLGKLLENHAYPDSFMIYLGGFDRFNSYVHWDIKPNILLNMSDSNSVVFDVKENGFELLESKGDSMLVNELLNKLKMAPSDWILLTPGTKRSLHFIFQSFRNPETKRVKFTFRFKYIDPDSPENKVIKKESEPILLNSPDN